MFLTALKMKAEKWHEIWMQGPQGATRVLTRGDFTMGDYVKWSTAPVLTKAAASEEGAFKFLPEKIDIMPSNKGLIVDEGKYLEKMPKELAQPERKNQ